MTTTEINYKGTDYTCRIVTSNEGESLIIGGLELLDALMPYPITDKCNGFADKEAERVDEEIFYYTSENDLKLPTTNLSQYSERATPNGLTENPNGFQSRNVTATTKPSCNYAGRLLLVTSQKPRLWETTKPPTSRRELIVLV